MKNKKIVILSLISILFMTLVLGLFFYINSQISPEKIRKIAVLELQKIFPNAKVNLGEIKYSFGSSIKFSADTFEMVLKKGKRKELIKVSQFSLSIPLLNIISGGGEIDLLLDTPQVSYVEYSEHQNNWTSALGKRGKKNSSTSKGKKAKRAKTKEKKTSGEIIVPAFAYNSKLNVRVKNLNLSYFLKDKTEGSLKINKLILKNVGLKGSSAFEVDSLINISIAKEKAKARIFIIGEVDLMRFIDKGEIETSISFQITDGSFTALNTAIPPVKANAKISLTSSGELRTTPLITIGEKSKIKATLFVSSKSEVTVSNISLDLLLSEFWKLSPVKIPEVDMNRSHLTVKGGVKIDKNGMISTKLDAAIFPGIKYEWEGNEIVNELSASINEKNVSLKVKQQIFGGESIFDFSLNLGTDLNKFSLNKIRPFSANLKIMNMKLEEKFFQKMIYKENSEDTAVEKSKMNVEKVNSEKSKDQMSLFFLPSGKLSVLVENVQLNNTPLSVDGIIQVKNNVIKIPHFNLLANKGSVKLNSKTIIKNIENIEGTFLFDISKILFEDFAFLLPKDYGDAVGVVNGKGKGSYKLTKENLKYSVASQLEALNGELKNLDLQSFIQGYLDKFSFLKGKKIDKKGDLKNSFEKVFIKGIFSDRHYSLENIYFKGINKKVEMKGKGHIYPEGKKIGIIDLTWIDSMGVISNHLKKEAGTTKLPIRLKGKGFLLLPDHNYTLEKVANLILKKQKKKQTQKLVRKVLKNKKIKKIKKILKNKKIKKKIDDVLKNKKAKKLLKGLF